MIYEDIELKLDYKKLGLAHDGYSPHLTAYVPDLRGTVNAGRSVLILPGGGYGFTSDREGEPVALEYVRRGFAAFVLWYSVAPNRYPCQLVETAESVRIIRGRAKEWKLDPEQLYVCGFSAGGHLAGSFTVLNGKGIFSKYRGGKERDYRVAGAILGYPVASMDAATHGETRENLMGEVTPELVELLSVEKQVTDQTPRMFLFHTAADSCVPVANSLLLASALAEHKVPFELHVYATREHGMSVGTDAVGYTEKENGLRHNRWVADSIEWIEGK